MISIINTVKNEAECIKLIDAHIWSDTDLELPDWGKYKQYHKGIHFVRKGKKLRGIYRLNDWNENEGQYKWKRYSIHMRFVGKLLVNKKGKVKILTVTIPQLSFGFLVFAFSLLTFAFWFKQDLEKTGFFAGLFGMGLCATVLEQLILEVKFIKAFKSFFKRKGN